MSVRRVRWMAATPQPYCTLGFDLAYLDLVAILRLQVANVRKGVLSNILAGATASGKVVWLGKKPSL